jgi:hypothetical protein
LTDDDLDDGYAFTLSKFITAISLEPALGIGGGETIFRVRSQLPHALLCCEAMGRERQRSIRAAIFLFFQVFLHDQRKSSRTGAGGRRSRDGKDDDSKRKEARTMTSTKEAGFPFGNVSWSKNEARKPLGFVDFSLTCRDGGRKKSKRPAEQDGRGEITVSLRKEKSSLRGVSSFG